MRFDLWVTQREDNTNEKYTDLNIRREYDNPKEPVVRIWRGKQSKPFINYIYQTLDRAEEKIKRVKDSADERFKDEEDRKNKKEQLLKNYQTDLKSGDILTDSWGYDQTNVEFYEVLEVKGGTVLLQEIGQDYVETNFMSGETKPDRSKKVGKPIKKRICLRVAGEKIRESVKICDSIRLTKWDGSLRYSSSYA